MMSNYYEVIFGQPPAVLISGAFAKTQSKALCLYNLIQSMMKMYTCLRVCTHCMRFENKAICQLYIIYK